jgi:hypothetical protein
MADPYAGNLRPWQFCPSEGSNYGSSTIVQTSRECDGTGTVESPFKSGISER